MLRSRPSVRRRRKRPQGAAEEVRQLRRDPTHLVADPFGIEGGPDDVRGDE